MPSVLRSLEGGLRDVLVKKAQPAWMAPMLATLTDDYFSDPDWIFERKLDGVRCLVFRKGNRVRVLSRNRNDMSKTYPELTDAIARQKSRDFIVDGEIVAFEGAVTSFSRLQQRIGITDPEEARHSGITVYLYLFDILHVDGMDATKLPLRERKKVLRRALLYRDPLRYTTHRNRDGEKLLAEACKKGWEGLIAKRADSEYVHKRSRDWLKFKCSRGQELVIGGWTDPRGSRTGFGALLVGYYDDGELRYAGKVGTGYDEQMLENLGARLAKLERQSCPFASEPQEKGAHWVSPKLVGEFAFTEWTRAGKLRHPRFLGLRTDKRAKQVVRERPRGSGAR